jgi:hypothetical protein
MSIIPVSSADGCAGEGEGAGRIGGGGGGGGKGDMGGGLGGVSGAASLPLNLKAAMSNTPVSRRLVETAAGLFKATWR